MQRIALFFVSLLISMTAMSKCASYGIYSVLKSSSLNKNGVIILEFYGRSQSIVEDLNKKYPIYFKIANDKIALLPIEILKGEFLLTQVVLRPSLDLKEGELYELHIDNLSIFDGKPQRYNKKTERWESITFTINNRVDREVPAFTNLPIETKKSLDLYGCGPAKWVYFKVSVDDKSETFVRTKVKNIITGKVTDFILPIEDGFVKVGHGMCSGGFLFDNGDNFEVSFSLLDQSANHSDFTDVIAFQKPILSGDKG